MTRRILQQEVEDYEKGHQRDGEDYAQQWDKVMGPYNAKATLYNTHLDRAKSGVTYLTPSWVGSKKNDSYAYGQQYYKVAGAQGDGLRVIVKYGGSQYGKNALSYSTKDGVTYGTDRYGTTPILPNHPGAAPAEPARPDPRKAPNFTQAQQRKLNSAPESRSAEVRDEGRSTLERTAAASNWSPFAASNAGEGVLMRAMKNKL